MTMRTRLFLLFILLYLTSCSNNHRLKYSSEWSYSPDCTWAGPSLWANRLQDWKVEDGRLVCINAKPMRTVHLTTRRAIAGKGNINSSVYITMNRGDSFNSDAAAGLLIGAGKDMDYRAASLIHHSYGSQGGLFAGLDANGNLFIRDFEKENDYLAYNEENDLPWKQAYIIFNIRPVDDAYSIRMTAVNPGTNQIIDRLEVKNIPEERILGNLALVSHSGYSNDPSTGFSFGKWQVSGSKLSNNKDQTIGPVMGLQYTLSRSKLKIKIQMAPLSEDDNRTLMLDIPENDTWKKLAETEIKKGSYIALFIIDNWNKTTDVPFRVRYTLSRKSKHEYTENGIIKHDPQDKNEITVLSLSCIEQPLRFTENNSRAIDGGSYSWDYGIMYPHRQLIDNLKQFDADLLYFAGDHVYEGGSPTVANTGSLANLDYLYRWYLWCQAYNELTSVIPSVSIPDYHDVYHGNIRGAGGKPVTAGLKGAAAQDADGYKMSPEFVNMVQETQTAHLPDPYDPVSAGQGINVYFTECNIGGVSFAILEDRKFKPAPGALFPEANIVNGWPLNPDWNARRMSVVDTSLLGARQMRFLASWAADWSGPSWMKAVLSQTPFANLATVPAGALTDDIVQSMEVPDSAITLNTDRIAYDFDSNGWPQSGRNKAIEQFRKAFATHITGDQHLASTMQYGINDFRDAGYVIVSPATGCIWTRRWHPPVEGRNRKEGWPPNLGDFEDGFGNKITVYAVANPHKSEVEPVHHNEPGTGYSVIKFYRDSRDIQLENRPYYAGPDNGKPFPFWPVRFNQLDNYGRKAVAWLPEVVCTGLNDPVIRIYRERTGEMIYALRIKGNSFQPKVFSFGNYKIEIGEPDSGTWQIIEGVNATSFRERKALDVSF